jgi:transcriptional regulator with XRE-family HTH domain
MEKSTKSAEKEAIGKDIRRLRKATGLTQQDLAERTRSIADAMAKLNSDFKNKGLNQSALSKIERGGNKPRDYNLALVIWAIEKADSSVFSDPEAQPETDYIQDAIEEHGPDDKDQLILGGNGEPITKNLSEGQTLIGEITKEAIKDNPDLHKKLNPAASLGRALKQFTEAQQQATKELKRAADTIQKSLDPVRKAMVSLGDIQEIQNKALSDVFHATKSKQDRFREIKARKNTEKARRIVEKWADNPAVTDRKTIGRLTLPEIFMIQEKVSNNDQLKIEDILPAGEGLDRYFKFVSGKDNPKEGLDQLAEVAKIERALDQAAESAEDLPFDSFIQALEDQQGEPEILTAAALRHPDVQDKNILKLSEKLDNLLGTSWKKTVETSSVYIRDLRKKEGIKQGTVAELSGIPQSRISAFENGEYRGWTSEKFNRLPLPLNRTVPQVIQEAA